MAASSRANAASQSFHDAKIEDKSHVYLTGTSARAGTTAGALTADDVIPA
jgi:hypothetical protein